jgi:hypothetical protein
MSSRAFYEAVADALVNFLPPSLRDFQHYYTAHNIKLWYGDNRQEHYEVQHIGERFLKGVKRKKSGPALEIGFHAEHREKERNEDVVGRILAKERTWRKALGADVEVAPFIYLQTGTWRRVSELWPDDGDGELAIDAAERLATYIRALEPVRQG